MAKKELAKTETGGTLALPAQVAGGCAVEGMDDGDILLPRLHIFQGTTTEQEAYPGFKRGDVLNTLTKKAVASRRFVPITGFKSWSLWEPGAKTPTYSHRNIADVPKCDLEWTKDGTRSIPPAATECWNFAVLVEGEPGPFMLVFKRTSVKAGKLLGNLERARGAAAAGPGIYTLTQAVDKNAAGQSYIRVGVEADGDPPAEMRELIVNAFAQLKGRTIKSDDDTPDADASIPI